MTDQVCLSVHKDHISCVDQLSFFLNFWYAGIGLPPSGSNINGPSYMETLNRQKNLAQNTIGFSMREDGSGTATFGADDLSTF